MRRALVRPLKISTFLFVLVSASVFTFFASFELFYDRCRQSMTL